MNEAAESPTLEVAPQELDFDEDIAIGVGTWISQDGFERRTRQERNDAVVVRFDALRVLELVDPWPRFRFTWSFPGGQSTALVGPSSAREESAFGARVEALSEHVRSKAPAAFVPGWLAFGDVAWEPVARMPRRPGDEPEVGREIAFAWRERTPFEALLAWRASRPALPWREQPREIAVSDDFVYVARQDGVVRVPLASLRKGWVKDSGDALFLFGRRTRIVLPGRTRCDVVNELLDRLDERAEAASAERMSEG